MKIVNRIVMAVIAAVTFPVFLTQTFFTAVLSIDEESTASLLLSFFLGKDNGLLNNRLKLTETVPELYKLALGKGEMPVSLNMKDVLASLPEEFGSVKVLVALSAIFIVLGLIIALTVIGCSIFTKAYKTMIGLSLGGAASFLMSIILFGRAARPFLDGTIDLAKTLADILIKTDSELVKFGASFLSGAIEVNSCGLGGAVFGAMMALFAAAVWEFAFYITLPENERKNLKAKKA